MARIQDATGNTPLHVASECGNASAVRSILAVCGSSGDHNALLQTPLALALARGHSPVISAFAERLLSPPLPPEPLHQQQPTAHASAQLAAPARMSRRATAGRWARMSLRDDVHSVQLSAVTRDVMASLADPGMLVAAAELGDFVLTQLIIDGGADVPRARRRRRGVVEICLSQIQVQPSLHSFACTHMHAQLRASPSHAPLVCSAVLLHHIR